MANNVWYSPKLPKFKKRQSGIQLEGFKFQTGDTLESSKRIHVYEKI